MQVPFESLKRTTRDRKYVIEELDAMLKGIRDTSQKPGTSTEEVVAQLGGMHEQLLGIKRKVRHGNALVLVCQKGKLCLVAAPVNRGNLSNKTKTLRNYLSTHS
jgi:hypothetical protein